MADSLRLFDPGWQARDSAGILSGAFIDVFLATTTTDLTAYSNAALSAALPNPIVCNSAGFPSSDGNTAVTVWVGTQDYRLRLRRADGTTVWDFDNQPGAVASTASESRKYIGECFYYLGSSAPDTSCIVMNGKTIGSASSGATARASDSQDTASTFSLLWNTFNNTVCPIQDSAGSPTTRGDTAAADFAANKRFPLLDTCGRALIGADNMGGVSSKNRLTGLSGGIDGDVPGNTGGSEGETISQAKLPSLTLPNTLGVSISNGSNLLAGSSTATSGTDNGVNPTTRVGGSNVTVSGSVTGSVTTGGSGTLANIVQPSIIIPLVLIYAGAP